MDEKVSNVTAAVILSQYLFWSSSYLLFAIFSFFEGEVCIMAAGPLCQRLSWFLQPTGRIFFSTPLGWDASPLQGCPQYEFILMGGKTYYERKVSHSSTLWGAANFNPDYLISRLAC